MFDGLLGRKFNAKCKSLIKLTKVRLEAIKKKRNAVQKYLKNDIADLLRNGLDINAYGRAEGLLVEQNMSSCYDLIEQFCGSISSNLLVMDKQRECPEECREAVASLIYAAARFADLPELRDLRYIFTQRFGNSFEPFVNREFVEKLSPKPPTKDMKLQLLQDIAQESSIEWNSKTLEQKLYTPPPPANDYPKIGSVNATYDDGYKLHETQNDDFAKRDDENARNKVRKVKEKEITDDGYRLPNNGKKEDGLIREANADKDVQKKSSKSKESVSKEELEKKPFYYGLIPAPYFRQKATRPVDSDSKNEAPADIVEASSDQKNHQEDDSVLDETDRAKPRSVRRKNLKPPPGHDYIGRSKGNDDHQEEDEEEKKLDTQLLHNSTKPSPNETEQFKANLKPPPGLRTAPHVRAKSLPDPTAPAEEAKGGRARTSSFDPNMAGHHVHPNLPDFDDLAARIAALSGR